MKIKNLRKTLEAFGVQYAQELINQLQNAGKVASGGLINSISYEVLDTPNGAQVIISSEEYLKWVDEGRRPGKFPPISAISNWASLKGIDQRAVWPIARKIAIEGIEPTNVIENTNRELINRFTGQLEVQVSEDLEFLIFTNINELR